MIEVVPTAPRGPDDPGCEYALCRRAATIALTINESQTPILVCSLHVEPILGWGLAEPLEAKSRYIGGYRPDTAA